MSSLDDGERLSHIVDGSTCWNHQHTTQSKVSAALWWQKMILTAGPLSTASCQLMLYCTYSMFGWMHKKAGVRGRRKGVGISVPLVMSPRNYCYYCVHKVHNLWKMVKETEEITDGLLSFLRSSRTGWRHRSLKKKHSMM